MLCRNLHVLKNVPQPVGDFLFSKARKSAGTTEAGAMVVDVPALFDFAGHHATIVSAREHPSERNFMLAVFRSVVAVQHRLHLHVQVRGDERLVYTLVRFAGKSKLANVEGVGQHLVEIRF